MSIDSPTSSATIQIGDIACPIVQSSSAAANHCLLCGLGPFQPDALATHFSSCFDSFCPINRAPAPVAFVPERRAFTYMNVFSGTRMPDIFSH
ncbi:hypothetical protein ACHHYP_10130 [Achlya hypogyna]|uniref:Uncharacterized protein n=1 Tax=Achlya hypogyna TaxID=1202772 RepID=A0A1V9ZI43_ACHHY|nr:hypothetical protein ACHHYP_10130 [Achlya hypogyna]